MSSLFPTQVKTKQLCLFLGFCTTGLISGYAAKRLSSPSPAEAPASGAGENAGGANSSGEDLSSDAASASKAASSKKEIKPSTLRSQDTLETLKSLAGAELYSRLALWMVDASEQDITSYWEHYRQQKPRSNDINDLIFINWTRVNPQGATATAKGTPDEHYAWWAWACHDPKGALQAAISGNPDRINNVTWGIGEFHPDWLRDHYDELPEDNRGNALSGMEKWDDKGDPLETLKFLEKNGRGFNPGIFKVLVMRDPWSAYDLIQERSNTESNIYSPYGGSANLMETFVNMVAENHPDVLKRIAEQSPSGEMKRKLEAKVFANLLEENPEEALKQAHETKAPVVASQRFAAIGMSYLSKDPDKAFAIAEELLATRPDAMNQGMRIDFGNSSSSWGGDSTEVGQLMQALFVKDPERLFDMKMPKPEEGKPYSMPLHSLGYQWAEQDVEAFAAWTGKQTDPSVRTTAASIMINKLQQDQNFADAVEWAMSVEQLQQPYLGSIVSQWRQVNPEEADAWLESANLPEKLATDLKNQIRARQQ